MPATPWISTVKTIKDGTDVSAAVVNPIFSQHTQRAQHLKELFDELANKSVLIAYNQPILPDSVGEVKKNSVVFGDLSGTTYGLALAKTEFAQSSKNTTAYTPANSSYCFGVVASVSNTTNTANVYLQGLVEFEEDMNFDHINTPSIIQSDERVAEDEEFVPGPLFLSRSEAGKLTRNPGGVAIYVGYAVSRKKLLLSPDVNEFSQFFTAYRYNILDRPAGKPYYNTLTENWELLGATEDNLKFVGWVPATEAYLGTEVWENHVPVDEDGNRPAFFYNLPSSTNILADTGIISEDRQQQKDLAAVLPPNPVNFSLLTVNGIIQSNTDLDRYGAYTINSIGLWWWSKKQNSHPWSFDINDREQVSIVSDEVEFTIPHSLELNDILVFESSGSLPFPLTEGQNYYVQAIVNDTTVKLGLTQNATSPISMSGGSGSHFVPQPYIWKFSRGEEVARPKMLLQFLKFSPALGESVVTSLQKFNNSSNIIRFYKPDKVTETTRGTGDLLARIVLSYVPGTQFESASTAISTITYNETTGISELRSTPVVSKIVGAGNINVRELTVGGVVKPGQYIISNDTNSQSGRVSSIEPDGAELIYQGLHSYLEFPYTSVIPSSFIGKIVLPSDAPALDMKLVFVMIGLTGLNTNATNRNVSFDFSYAVSKPGSVLGSASSIVTATFPIPLISTGYVQKTVFKVGAGLVASTYSVLTPEFTIPASAFVGGDCAVNFKLSRATPSTNPYAYPVGIVDMYWKL